MTKFQVILALVALIGFSTALDCIQPPTIVPGHFLTIPAGANETVEIPPNWSCTYSITPPPMVFSHVTLENGLQGNNDLITVRDEQGTRTLVAGRSSRVLHFYIYPNTTTTFQIVTKSVNMHSSFRIRVSSQKLLSPTVTQLGNQNSKYFMLNDLQANSYKTPQTVQANEKILLSIAQSGWDADLFDNYFVIDGDFQKPKYIYRMNRFLDNNYISTENILTVVGLDNRVSESSVVFTPVTQTQQFDSINGIGTYYEANKLVIDSTSGEKKKKAANVVSMSDSVTILDVQKNSDCSLKAVPAISSSEIILDFSTVTQYPTNINHKSFALISENCAATLKMVSS